MILTSFGYDVDLLCVAEERVVLRDTQLACVSLKDALHILARTAVQDRVIPACCCELTYQKSWRCLLALQMGSAQSVTLAVALGQKCSESEKTKFHIR
jgi:hypothetical protein